MGKRPQGLRRTVVIVFGAPMAGPVTAACARQAVLELTVKAHALCPPNSRSKKPPDCDLSLPCWHHESLGLLAHAAPDYDRGGIKQVGYRSGSVGQAALGVALRVVGELGRSDSDGDIGRIEALVGDHANWIDTGRFGRIDRDGFVYLVEPTA